MREPKTREELAAWLHQRIVELEADGIAEWDGLSHEAYQTFLRVAEWAGHLCPEAEDALGSLPEGHVGLGKRLLRKFQAALASLRGVKPASKVAEALGERRYRVGNTLVTLTNRQDSVLAALAKQGTADLATLRENSGYRDAPKVLREIVKAHPALKKHIVFPGKKGKGGYRTDIVPSVTG